jgi:hypothetical protein
MGLLRAPNEKHTRNGDECEGYTNWETYSIGVWLSNDYPLYNKCIELTKAAAGNRQKLADDLKAYVESLRGHRYTRDTFEGFRQAKLDFKYVDWLDVAETFEEALKRATS